MKIESGFNPIINTNEQIKTKDKTLEKIASAVALGLEDSASRTIADALQNQISSMGQGLANANDGIAMMQIAGSTLNNLSVQADRLGELNVRANSASLNDSQRQMLHNEFNATVDTMSQSIENTSFNGVKLFGNNMELSLGEGVQNISLSDIQTNSLDMGNSEALDSFRANLNQATLDISASTSALTSATNNLMSGITSTSNARSQMADTDISSSVGELEKANLKLSMNQIIQSHQQDLMRQQISHLLG